MLRLTVSELGTGYLFYNVGVNNTKSLFVSVIDSYKTNMSYLLLVVDCTRIKCATIHTRTVFRPTGIPLGQPSFGLPPFRDFILNDHME